MSLERLARILLTAFVWIAPFALVLIGALIMGLLGFSMPTTLVTFVLGIVMMLTLVIWTPAGWDGLKGYYKEHIARQIEEQMILSSEKDLLEAREGLAEFRSGFKNFRLEFGNKKKNDKDKRHEVLDRLRDMSDDEIREIRARLGGGVIDDEQLYDLLIADGDTMIEAK